MTRDLKEDVSIEELGPSKAFQAAFDAIPSMRRKLFFKNYWLDGCRNIRAATMKAGYADSGGSQQGTTILRTKEGRAVMKAWIEEIGCTPASILVEFHQINNASLYDFRGLFEGKSLEELQETGIDLRQIKKFKITRRMRGTGGNAYEVEDISVELYDRLKALITMAKILKMFSDVGDQGSTVETLVEMLHKSKEQRETNPDDVKAALQNGGAAHGSDHT